MKKNVMKRLSGEISAQFKALFILKVIRFISSLYIYDFLHNIPHGYRLLKSAYEKVHNNQTNSLSFLIPLKLTTRKIIFLNNFQPFPHLQNASRLHSVRLQSKLQILTGTNT
jgi:hypothetical protein